MSKNTDEKKKEKTMAIANLSELHALAVIWILTDIVNGDVDISLIS